MSKGFRHSIDAALSNPSLRLALGRFSEAYRVSRDKAYKGIDFEQVRTSIAEAKSHAVGHLDELAATFARNAAPAGAKVLQASSSQEVKDYILSLSQCDQRPGGLACNRSLSVNPRCYALELHDARLCGIAHWTISCRRDNKHTPEAGRVQAQNRLPLLVSD
jgi:hypothetical protein